MPKEATPPQANPNKLSTADVVIPNGPSLPAWVFKALMEGLWPQIVNLKDEVATIRTKVEIKEREKEHQLKKWHVIVVAIVGIATTVLSTIGILILLGLLKPFS